MINKVEDQKKLNFVKQYSYGKRLTFNEIQALDDGYRHAYMRCILDSDDEVNKYLNEVKTRLQTTRAEKAQLISEIAKIQQTWEFHQKDFDTKMEILIVERRESEKKKNNPNGKANL